MDDHMRILKFRLGESSAEPKHMIHLEGVAVLLHSTSYDPGRRAHDHRHLA